MGALARGAMQLSGTTSTGAPPDVHLWLGQTPVEALPLQSKQEAATRLKRDGSLQVAAVCGQQQKAYLSWKIALPTACPLILMSTRYVPGPSALDLRLSMYWLFVSSVR
jgi:hypothetical protein